MKNEVRSAVDVVVVSRWQIKALRDFLRYGDAGISAKVATDLGADACAHCGRVNKRPVGVQLDLVMEKLAAWRVERLGFDADATAKIDALRYWLIHDGMTRAQMQLTGYDRWRPSTITRLIELFDELFSEFLAELD